MILALHCLTGPEAWTEPRASRRGSSAPPVNPHLPSGVPSLPGYRLLPGGLSQLRPGAFVEGSWRLGGIQPDYYLDPDQGALAPLMAYAESLNTPAIPVWGRVQAIVNAVQETMPDRRYTSPTYMRLNRRYRGRTIPLSEYAACGAGVCREYALVTHFALQAAGIPNLHAYSRTLWRILSPPAYEVIEDHAFNVIFQDGELWVVDAFQELFHGYRLSDLLHPEGLLDAPGAPPAVRRTDVHRRILEINPFPRAWIPSPAIAECPPRLPTTLRMLQRRYRESTR